MRILLIGLAGFAGSLARWLVAKFFNDLNTHFPLGTLVVNITGSLFLGWFLSYAAKQQLSETTRIAIAVGFVGTYTTFSTYMYESFKLIGDGEGLKASVNLFGSLALGLAAVWVGTIMARYT